MPTIITREQFDLARDFTMGDIRREVSLARVTEGLDGPERKAAFEASGVNPRGGGNLLAALGLLCYTEFFGLVKFDERYPPGHPKARQRKPSANFNSFFDELGADYRAFRTAHDAPGRYIYDILRCGMAHEYFVKQTFSVRMLNLRVAPTGVLLESGVYIVVVEKYLSDLAAAVDRLAADPTLVFPLTRA